MYSNYLIYSYNCSMFTCEMSFKLRSLFVLLDFPLTLQLNICSSTRRSSIFYIPNGSNAKAFCRFKGWFCSIEKILIILSKQKINSYHFSDGISVALSSVPYCRKERQFNPCLILPPEATAWCTFLWNTKFQTMWNPKGAEKLKHKTYVLGAPESHGPKYSITYLVLKRNCHV